jgi:hypothetical protein
MTTSHSLEAQLLANQQSILEHRNRILNERRSSDSFVVIGKTLHDMYYKDKQLKTQKDFLNWTKTQLGFSKSTTYEYIISYKIYSEIESGLEALGSDLPPPIYQSHCQLLAKIPKENLVASWVEVLRQAGEACVTTAFLESFLEARGLLTKTPR